MTLAPPDVVLPRALAKIEGREAAFVLDVAGGRERDLVCKTFNGLSWEEHFRLLEHFAERIAAARLAAASAATQRPSFVDRSLPCGDRD